MQTQTSFCFARWHPNQKVPVRVRCIRSRTQASNTEAGFQHYPLLTAVKLSFDTHSACCPGSFAAQKKERGDVSAWKKMGIQTTSQMRVAFGIISVGDVLMHNNLAVTVLSCCHYDGFFISVQRWSYVRSSSSARWWRATIETELIPAALASQA